MSRLNRLIFFSAAILMAVSCARSARIDAVLTDLASSDVIVKALNINRYDVLDTVSVDQEGRLIYKVDLQGGEPEFVYLFHNDTKIASLILQCGDRVKVEADTLGNYSVEGSEESARLSQVEHDYSQALSKMTAVASRLQQTSDPEQVARLRQELGHEYISYYRSRVKYIMENSHSLSVVPVFYQNFGQDLPVFAQTTDAIHFKNVADSLAQSYPDSKYVKALGAEAERRMGYLELEARLNSAKEISYPDIELPDLQAVKHKLSEVDSKVIMVHFWTATDASQKMFNLDVLKPLHEEFHDKGFEIYQVSLDTDKGLWARVVKEQNLPWISVCDSRGPASPYVATYNLQAFPSTYIISDGELVDGETVDMKSIRKLIGKLTR